MKKLIVLLLLCITTFKLYAGSCCDKRLSPISKLEAYGRPIGLASSGTMGANGALTLTTAANQTYSNGIWWHFPAAAVFSGSAAGFYWTVMTSTTAGTVYNNVYTPGGSAMPPASPTAVSDAGPGAYTALISEITLVDIIIPGNSLGPNGYIRTESVWNYTNSANNKNPRIRLGGIAGTAHLNVTATGNASLRIDLVVQNRGSVSGQISWVPSHVPGYGTSSSNPTTSTINTANNTTQVFTGQKATAAENMVLERSNTTIYYAPW